MPPVPASKAVELFNRLAELELGDVETAMAMYFDLRSIVRKQPSDPTGRIALAEACRIIGYRDQALEHLDVADQLWSGAAFAVRNSIAGLMGKMGQAKRSRERFVELICAQEANKYPTVIWNTGSTGFLCGDIGLLNQASHREQQSGIEPYAGTILSALDALELKPLFPSVQAVVTECVGPCLMDFEFAVQTHPDDGRSFISFKCIIDGSKIYRWDLAELINERLEAVFEQQPTPIADWWWRYSVSVEEAPRHASIPAAPRSRRAA